MPVPAGCAAVAQVLGDRSLKVKHLNRHALLVASGAHPGAVVDPQELQLHVELLDAVTGRPLFRQVHQVRSRLAQMPELRSWV